MFTTGIGSLPFTSIHEACKFSFQFDLPFLPQLPQLEERELMLAQVNSPHPPLCQEQFWHMASSYPRPRNSTLLPSFKTQVVGPATLVQFSPQYQAMPLAQVPWEIVVQKCLKSVLPFLQNCRDHQAQAVVFIDEPFIPDPQTSSPQHLQAVLWAWKELLKHLQQDGAVVGIHCCQQSIPVEILLDLPWDYISFDFHLCGDLFLRAQNVTSYLKRGGKFALGVLATLESKNTRKNTDEENFKIQKIKSFLRTLSTEGEGWGLTINCGLALTPPESCHKLFTQLQNILKKLG